MANILKSIIPSVVSEIVKLKAETLFSIPSFSESLLPAGELLRETKNALLESRKKESEKSRSGLSEVEKKYLKEGTNQEKEEALKKSQETEESSRKAREEAKGELERVKSESLKEIEKEKESFISGSAGTAVRNEIKSDFTMIGIKTGHIATTIPSFSKQIALLPASLIGYGPFPTTTVGRVPFDLTNLKATGDMIGVEIDEVESMLGKYEQYRDLPSVSSAFSTISPILKTAKTEISIVGAGCDSVPEVPVSMSLENSVSLDQHSAPDCSNQYPQGVLEAKSCKLFQAIPGFEGKLDCTYCQNYREGKRTKSWDERENKIIDNKDE